MRSRYIVRIVASTAAPVDVTADGYLVRSWRTDSGKYAWWVAWEDAASELEIEPERNHANGLLVVADSSGMVEISADRFGTVPAFYRETADGLLVSNDFDAVAAESSSEPDEIGFWETVLFETPFAERTLLRGVKYLSAGTTLTFTPRHQPETRRYWNLTFETLDVKTDEECASLCTAVLVDRLKSYPSVPNVLPISGGLDSRLLAAALRKAAPEAPVTGVTYGYHKCILEYAYAKQVLRRLGWTRPHFHRLEPDSYVRCMDPLVRRTGALIGMQNCHLFDYLMSRGADDRPVLSGMYSDGACGYSASIDLTGVDKLTAFEHVSALWKKALSLELPDRIVEGIYADLQAMRADWRNGSSITSFNEYAYVRERNAKFHLLMADSWRMFAPVRLPFADPKVATTFLSLPTRYREHKRCTVLATHHLAPELDGMNNVRSAYWKFGLGSKRLQFEHLWVGLFNRRIERLLGSRFLLPDRAETERHHFNLHCHHAAMCRDACAKLMDFGLCDKRTVTRLATLRAEAFWPHSYYQLISSIHALTHYAR